MPKPVQIFSFVICLPPVLDLIPVHCGGCDRRMGASQSSHTVIICEQCLVLCLQWMDYQGVMERNPIAILLLQGQGGKLFGPGFHSGNIREKPNEFYYITFEILGSSRFGFQAVKFPLTQ